MATAADLVVVGGGLAGLVAGATAARSGRRVVLLEGRTTMGGRARSTEHHGFVLNEGAHALYLGGEALPVLRGLGVEPTGAPPALAGAMGLRGGKLGLLPAGPATLLRSPLLGVRGKARLGGLLSRIGRVDPAPLAGRTFASWLEEACPEPDARAVVASVARTATYANDPEHVSAGAVVTQLQRALHPGVLYLDGGWQRLVDGARAAAVRAGADLRPGTKVERVVPGPRPLVVTSGEELPAASVVLAGLAPAAVAALLDGASPTAATWAEDVRPSRAAALDVCLPTPWTGPTSVVLGIDEPVYLSVHSVAQVAPEGSSLVSLLRYLHPDEPGDAERDRGSLGALLDLVRPGWRADAVDVRFQHRLTAAHDVPAAMHGGLAGRPGPAVPDVDGVWLAGDWVGPVGMLADASVASAVAAVRAANVAAVSA